MIVCRRILVLPSKNALRYPNAVHRLISTYVALPVSKISAAFGMIEREPMRVNRGNPCQKIWKCHVAAGMQIPSSVTNSKPISCGRWPRLFMMVSLVLHS
jgi:hypothetical protein